MSYQDVVQGHDWRVEHKSSRTNINEKKRAYQARVFRIFPASRHPSSQCVSEKMTAERIHEVYGGHQPHAVNRTCLNGDLSCRRDVMDSLTASRYETPEPRTEQRIHVWRGQQQRQFTKPR